MTPKPPGFVGLNRHGAGGGGLGYASKALSGLRKWGGGHEAQSDVFAALGWSFAALECVVG